MAMTSKLFKHRMFLALVKISGRDPADYSVSEVDNQIHVEGPHASAVYSGLHWISQFSRDLYSGFFEQALPALDADVSKDENRVLH
jgi:hypothetical protein